MKLGFALASCVVACSSSAKAPATPTHGSAETPAHKGHDGHPGHHGHHGDGHGGMMHSFKGADEWAKVFDDPARDEWQKPDEVVAAMAIAPGMTVADLGAGTGYFVSRLSKAAGATGAVLALDVETDMVEYMKQRAAREGWQHVTPQLTASDAPTLVANSVDRILIVDVWHHLENRTAYAAKLAAALKPGGAVIVVDFEMDSPMGPGKAMRILPAALAAELQTAGLKTELPTESLPYQYIVVARKPA